MEFLGITDFEWATVLEAEHDAGLIASYSILNYGPYPIKVKLKVASSHPNTSVLENIVTLEVNEIWHGDSLDPHCGIKPNYRLFIVEIASVNLGEDSNFSAQGFAHG